MARREYARTSTDMPEENSIKALDVEAQWLYDRLRFRAEISRCGVVPWRPAVFAELGRNASDAKVKRWVKQLVDRSHVVLDEPYAEILVRTFVRWDGLLAQPNVVPHLVYDFGLISSPKVRLGFLKEFRRLWDLPDLKDAERGGWLLAVGHFPRRKHAKDDPAKWPAALEATTLTRLINEIGTGLRRPLTSAITAGDIPPFDEGSPHGIPDLFRPPHQGTPSPHPSDHPTGEGSSRAHVSAGARTVLRPTATENENGDGTPETHPTDDPVGRLLREHAAAYETPPPPSALIPVRNAVTRLIAQGTQPDRVRAGLERMRDRQLSARLLPELVAEATPTRNGGATRPDRNTQILTAARRRAEAAESQHRRALP